MLIAALLNVVLSVVLWAGAVLLFKFLGCLRAGGDTDGSDGGGYERPQTGPFSGSDAPSGLVPADRRDGLACSA